MDKEVKRSVTKYKWLVAIIMTVYVLGVLVPYFIFDFDFLLLVGIMIAALIVFILLMTTVQKKLILKFIREDCDPVRYHAAMSAISKHDNYGENALSLALNTGDHQSTVNICSSGLADPKLHKARFLYWDALALMYFFCNDMERLRLVCKTDLEAMAVEKRAVRKVLEHHRRGMVAYLSLADGDPSALLSYSREMAKKAKNRHARLLYSFYMAVALFKSGQLEESKSLFRLVVDGSPLLHISRVSKRYLYAIENGACDVPVEPVPHSNAKVKLSASRKSGLRIASIVLLILSVVLYLISVAIPELPYTDDLYYFYDTYWLEDVRDYCGDPDIEGVVRGDELTDIYYFYRGDMKFSAKVNYLRHETYFEKFYLDCVVLTVSSEYFESIEAFRLAVEEANDYLLEGYEDELVIEEATPEENFDVYWYTPDFGGCYFRIYEENGKEYAEYLYYPWAGY